MYNGDSNRNWSCVYTSAFRKVPSKFLNINNRMIEYLFSYFRLVTKLNVSKGQVHVVSKRFDIALILQKEDRYGLPPDWILISLWRVQIQVDGCLIKNQIIVNYPLATANPVKSLECRLWKCCNALCRYMGQRKRAISGRMYFKISRCSRDN